MKILGVTSFWHPHRGGLETVVLEQARRLSLRDHQVSIVSSRLSGDAAFSEIDGFSLYRVPAANWTERKLGIPYPLFSPQLLPLLARLTPQHDVVLIHNHTYLSSVAGSLVARVQRRPIVLLQYSPFVQYRFPWNAVEWVADHLLGEFTLRSATKVLAISKFTRAYVEQLVPHRHVEVLPLGVDTRRFTAVRSTAQQKAIRRSFGLPDNALILLTVRRLVFRNGLDTLIEAARLLKDRSDVFVAIAGSGPERNTLEQVIARDGLRNVRLMGSVPDDDLPDLYRAADVFVLPSRTGEGFGLVLLEAFSSGIPAVATSGGGQEEILQHGLNGLLVPPSDPEALAEAVLTLRKRPSREAMGAAAHRIAVERDWERSIDKLEDVLAHTAASGSYSEHHMSAVPGQFQTGKRAAFGPAHEPQVQSRPRRT